MGPAAPGGRPPRVQVQVISQSFVGRRRGHLPPHPALRHGARKRRALFNSERSDILSRGSCSGKRAWSFPCAAADGGGVHPGTQLALTLRLACGLSVDEIAHALLTPPQSIMQRIVRAKRELRDADVTFDIAPRELV
ncbi:MAG TPA: sigma factor-like helix-turn-helix DNA-binding protein [Steroidobacter sp.]|nr:sigma factor-like helix-turn-helix DNA-binding protein [Steroidobacter sp.]